MTRDRQKELRKAKQIRDTLGVWVAARFMCKRGWSLEAARHILLGV